MVTCDNFKRSRVLSFEFSKSSKKRGCYNFSIKRQGLAKLGGLFLKRAVSLIFILTIICALQKEPSLTASNQEIWLQRVNT